MTRIDRPPLSPRVFGVANLTRLLADEAIERETIDCYLVNSLGSNKCTETADTSSDRTLLARRENNRDPGGGALARAATVILAVGTQPVESIAVAQHQRRPPRRVVRYLYGGW
jgi:hypothetical protein